MKRKVVLCILDGWGIGPSGNFNGLQAATYWPEILKKYPNTKLEASESYVGLPDLQMGNSEVGHMTIGLGRVLLQDLPKIDQQFASGAINSNPFILKAIEQLKNSNKPCHIMGLLSSGGVHSHIKHIIGAAKLLATNGITVYVHGFLDGRDTPPQSAGHYVDEFLKATKGYANIQLVTLSGRYYSWCAYGYVSVCGVAQDRTALVDLGSKRSYLFYHANSVYSTGVYFAHLQ